MVEKKMRIQVFEETGAMISDRLLAQDPEIYTGPKLQHSGKVLRIEVTLANKDDVDKVTEYIKKLTGDLPLTSKEVKKLKNVDTMAGTPREEIWADAKAKAKDQGQLITYLRDNYGFRFVGTDFLEHNELSIGMTKAQSETYIPMVRCVKVAKDPKLDKFDPQIAVAFKLFGEPFSKVLVFINGELAEKYKLPFTTKTKINFQKSEAMKFPAYMHYDEREKFRKEHRILMTDKDKEKSKFYIRWEKYVMIPENWGVKNNVQPSDNQE